MAEVHRVAGRVGDEVVEVMLRWVGRGHRKIGI